MGAGVHLGMVGDTSSWGSSRSGRVLQNIRRFADMTQVLMRARRRNEEILSLAYQDESIIGGGGELANLRENALNLPYRYARWVESQMVSKQMVVKTSRDAGPGQIPGGPGDTQTGMWTGITLGRVAYEGGFKNEIRAVIREFIPRGTSVMAIGYHEDVIDQETAEEAGKAAQSVMPDVLGEGDMEARVGQDHGEISSGLQAMAEDEKFLISAGTEGVKALLERKDSHDDALLLESLDMSPRVGSRLIRRKIWMRKLRVGEDVGWSPQVYDVEDTEYWWDRHVWTVAQVKASALFTDSFKAQVEGYDARNVSGVFHGAETVSTESMGSDARQAMTEGVLDEDERLVEWFSVWYRRPDMPSGGYRRIVCAEVPDEFIEADESNPHVNDKGKGVIPGFYPFTDFTPVKSSLTVPEATLGIPPMSVGMTQFEKLAEYNRLRHESALRHSLRLYQIHPGLKGDKQLIDALNEGKDGFAYFAPSGSIDQNGKMQAAVIPIQFTGNTQEIDKEAAREESDWVKVMGMPPAILQGMGTAETASQDQLGVAAGERESGSMGDYMEERVAHVLEGVRGLMRASYDDEDYQKLLGEEGAQVMKAWALGTTDDGDVITVTSGVRAMAQALVEKKQLMEAITLEKAEIDPVTGLQIFDSMLLFEELHRRLDVGPPQINQSMLSQLQQAVIALAQQVQQQRGGDAEGVGQQEQQPRGGPNPSEGDGPTQGNLQSGAMRGTVTSGSSGAQEVERQKAGQLQGMVPSA